MTTLTETRPAPAPLSSKALFGVFAAISVLLLAVGGWLTSLGLGEWYRELTFPPFQPPAWAFTPAWITIFALLTFATHRVATAYPRQPAAVRSALVLYALQCVLNIGWSLLFFAWARPDWALWEILALDVVLVAMTVAYWRVSARAGAMLVPYVLWLGLATAINAWIVQAHGPWGP